VPRPHKCRADSGREPRRWLNECGEIGEPEAKGARSFTIRLVRRCTYIRSSVSQPLTLRGTRNLFFTLKPRELRSRVSVHMRVKIFFFFPCASRRLTAKRVKAYLRADKLQRFKRGYGSSFFLLSDVAIINHD